MNHVDAEVIEREQQEMEERVVSTAMSPMLDEDSDDEAECRVCRGEAEPDRRLFAPCKCSGSIRFTHSDCLEQWLEHSGKAYCELCGYKFEFKPLYDANAPDVLPWTELVSTVLRMVCFKWVPFIVRAALVIVLWLGVAPWCTSWLYRMWLLRASAMVNVNFSERFDSDHVVADIFSGILLIVVIIFSFLALMSFADFLRFHLDHIDDPIDDIHMQNVQPVRRAPDREGRQENVDELLERPDRRGVPAGLRPLDGGEESDEDVDHHGHEEGNDAMPFHGVFAPHPREDLGLPEIGGVQHQGPDQELRHRRPVRNADNVERNAGRQDNVAPLQPPRNPAPPRNRPNPPNNNQNREWDDDFEHMEINIAMDELLGLRGDIVVLFRNVSWLLAFNGAYLGLFAFIPYTLGSTIMSASSKILAALPITPSIVAFFELSQEATMDELGIAPFIVRSLLNAMENAKKSGDCLQLVDLCTCAMGYLSICFTIVLWRWMVTTASSYIHRPLMGGLLWALRCLTAIVKVSTLLLLKMVVLPIVLGIGIDLSTLQLFEVTVQERITFCMQNMVGSLLIHWVLGITFMLFVTVSVLQLREVMHPDILAKVIRPQEAHPDLLRSLLSEKSVKHARRMALSLLIYAALLVVLIHLPIRFAKAAVPQYFPLELRFQHYSPEVQVPLELLVVHLVVLAILEHAKNEIGRLQHLGIKFIAEQLRLTEYLMPRIEVTRNHQRAAHVLAPPPLHFHPHAELPPEELRVDGHRYLPWPEDGLDDPQPTEYDLLPRQTPHYVRARLATLLVVCWFLLVTTVGGLLFGTFLLGRVCMGPFERWTGITHDPLAMAAGVQIMWYLVNGLNALNMLTLPEDQVERALINRGYTVKNMNVDNAMISVIGWAFICPFLVGYIVSSCFPAANASWFEGFWMGYLVFNLFVWFVCCFRTKKNRRRNNRRDDGMNDGMFDEDFEDFDDLDDDLDDLDEEFEEDDQHVAHELNGVAPPAPGQDELEGFIASLKTSYKQLMFTITVHHNDTVRLRRDNIRDRCFDVEFFLEKVLYPGISLLLVIFLLCTVESAVIKYIWASPNSDLQNTAFATAVIGTAAGAFLLRSHTFVTKWMGDFAESIRNERYLIGRQLQDMAR
ncbi:hypothetical protein Poli38472_008594 [Pythium oligandrum]|uniref:RING-type E3 ubiquitin transferase n=1 Tax=Pythium oligandrum TaxID=41045 RepID=A0A8K1C3U4_PYTOL|nr:hypothetical protein Poli38472_008594 [Pythium oligandrum]|eukprot:TMW55946.1 hypothetical protein Poli38472_008594 [Pythium oligandrum]